MKKSIILSIAAAVIFALAVTVSCNNLEEVTESDPEPEASGEIILHATVSDPGGDDSGTNSDSKAYFNSSTHNWVWEGGEVIKIWYGSNTQTTPDGLIGYSKNTNNWAFTSGTTSGNTPSSSGTLKAVYSIDGVTITTTSKYTYSKINGSNHLFVDLKDWKYLSEIRVIMEGLTSSDASKYTLACDRFYPITGYSVGSSSITAAKGDKGAAVTGISNSGGKGVAFVFATCDSYGSSATYNFTLMSKDKNQLSNLKKTATTLNKVTNFTKIKSIKLTSTLTTYPLYVEIGGVKWATMNVGATTVAGSPSTSFGDYFAWGETTPRYTSITINSKSSITFGGWKSDYSSIGYNDSKYYKGNVNTLDSDHDAATYNWGSEWRTPTLSDFNNLIKACGGSKDDSGTWDENVYNYKKNKKGVFYLPEDQTTLPEYTGVPGYLFVSGSSSDSPRVFFPAAGCIKGKTFDVIDTGTTTDRSYGFYWTASYKTSWEDTECAYSTYLAPADQYNDTENCGIAATAISGSLGQRYRYYGRTIRPVLK